MDERYGMEHVHGRQESDIAFIHFGRIEFRGRSQAKYSHLPLRVLLGEGACTVSIFYLPCLFFLSLSFPLLRSFFYVAFYGSWVFPSTVESYNNNKKKDEKKNKYSYLIINSIDVVCHQIRTRCNERGRNWFCFSLPLWIFSSRFLRNKDRDDNKDNYPALHWPEVYLLHGGYKAFFQQHESSCTPLGYLPMNQQGHEEDLRRCRAKTKSCNGDGKSGRPLTKSTSRRLELLWCSDCTLKENLIS